MMIEDASTGAEGSLLKREANHDLYLDVLAIPLPKAGLEHIHRYSEMAGTKSVVYLSTPITTGPKYLEWMRSFSNESAARRAAAERELKAEIMAENLKAVEPLRAKIRKSWSDYFLIDPTAIEEPTWGQQDYHRFWLEVITQFPQKVAFADGWELSTGCCLEFICALENGLPVFDSNLHAIDPIQAIVLLDNASRMLEEVGLNSGAAQAALERARLAANRMGRGRIVARVPLKDDRLRDLANRVNVAIFASFEPHSADLRHFVSRRALEEMGDMTDVVTQLMRDSREGSLNVRSFRAGESKSSPFHYGIRDIKRVVGLVEGLARDGFYTIVNETLDVDDGGVSGVQLGNLVEFAPGVTPRGVEKTGSAQMSTQMAVHVLSRVYGFSVKFDGAADERVEFSLHPARVGSRGAHTIDWEIELVEAQQIPARVNWPNDFSRMIGDKVFGLLVAESIGLNVPRTITISRKVAPFTFGKSTGSAEWWMRTAPGEAQPGRFTTTQGWTDPFSLLSREDQEAEVSSILSQEAVPAEYSGAASITSESAYVVEGVRGPGDRFMLGEARPEELPKRVREAVHRTCSTLMRSLGPVEIEWVFDGDVAWVVQLHLTVARGGQMLSTGESSKWRPYHPSEGLDALRKLISEIRGTGEGVEVTEPVGVTSHVGDLLRKAHVPARFSR